MFVVCRFLRAFTIVGDQFKFFFDGEALNWFQPQNKNSGIKRLLPGSRIQLFGEKFIGKKRNSARDNPVRYYG